MTLPPMARRLLPPLWLLALLCYVDRSAVAFAAPAMNGDLGLTDADYGVGVGIGRVVTLYHRSPNSYRNR